MHIQEVAAAFRSFSLLRREELTELVCVSAHSQSGEHLGPAVVGLQRDEPRRAGSCGKEPGGAPPAPAGPEGRPHGGTLDFFFIFFRGGDKSR